MQADGHVDRDSIGAMELLKHRAILIWLEMDPQKTHLLKLELENPQFNQK